MSHSNKTGLKLNRAYSNASLKNEKIHRHSVNTAHAVLSVIFAHTLDPSRLMIR